MKSTFTLYDKWELPNDESLRYYYFTITKERQRRWVIKRKVHPKNEIITEEQAYKLVGNTEPTICLRFWDKERQKATRIEQRFNRVTLQIGDVKQTLSESLKSILKRIMK